MYCRNCREMYEPEVPNALHGAKPSLRTMLISAYMKIGMEMRIENVSTTMKELFGIGIYEGRCGPYSFHYSSEGCRRFSKQVRSNVKIRIK